MKQYWARHQGRNRWGAVFEAGPDDSPQAVETTR